MRSVFLLAACFALPAEAQDAGRGKLLYETQCGGCHYERVHQRAPGRTSVQTLADLRDEVARRAAQTGRLSLFEPMASDIPTAKHAAFLADAAAHLASYGVGFIGGFVVWGWALFRRWRMALQERLPSREV